MQYTTRSLTRRRGTDKWELRLIHKDPLTGDPVITFHTVEGSTQKKAEKARDELVRELEQKGATATSDVTLSEFLDEFIRFKEEGGLVERSTLNHYRKEAKVLKRYIGGYRLAEVRIPVISSWMAQMTAEGYAPRSVVKPFGLLKQAMKHAVMLDLITKNPCEYCKPPKITRKKLQVLDREERTRMLELATAAEPDSLALAIELALTTGMRRGEICALRWSDLGEYEITVNRAISLDDGTPYEKEPKTEGSHRTIPLTGRLYAVLRAIEKDRRYVAAELGVPFGDPFILGTPDPNSRPYHPTQLTRDFHAFCKMNGFNLTFHDLRHTFATMMVAVNTDISTVASYLGHSNVAMTLNTYAEVDPDAKRAALGKINEAFNMDLEGAFSPKPRKPERPSSLASTAALTFTVEQLEAMLAQAKRNEEAGCYEAV